MDKPRNFIISDVTLNWARLDTPVSPFGTPQWELQVATADADKAAELKANHFNVKEKDGMFTVSLKRKAVKADGSAMDPVRVVDANKMPVEKRSAIGNGSKGNVIVWQAPYNTAGRSGIAASLTAVQVTEMVEYNGGGDDFDIVTSEEAPAAQGSADLF